MNIHRIINYRLQTLGITRYRMAKDIDATPANFYRFLNGERRTISAEKMVTLAEKIGLSNYSSLFELEKPADLINYLDTKSKQSSFLKALFYLSLIYDYHYYNLPDVDDVVLSLSDTINNYCESSEFLNHNSVLQYIADFLLYTKSETSPVAQLFINERFGRIVDQDINYSQYHPFHDNLDFDVDSFQRESDVLMELQNHDFEKDNNKFNINIPEPRKAAQLHCAYRWRVDIYYQYINESIDLGVAIQKLDEIEKIAEKLEIEPFGDFDFLFYQIFNGEIPELPILATSFYNITNRTRNIALYSKIVGRGMEFSLYHYLKPLRISFRETTNQIIGVLVPDDGVSKVLPKDTFALVELDTNIQNGDYALISINENDAIVARVYLLSEKILVEFNSHYSDLYKDITYKNNEVTIFGKVIEGVSLI